MATNSSRRRRTATWIKPLSVLTDADQVIAGGKAVALGRVAAQVEASTGFAGAPPGAEPAGGVRASDLPGIAHLQVPQGFCLLTPMYRAFLEDTGLHSFLELELGRKRFQDMRWEEIWDASLRIRNAFLRAPMPEVHHRVLSRMLAGFPDGAALAVRSSAPGEDSQQSSFAGLHESFVNVRGIDALADAVRGVWASLWSDRALLYRQELGLHVERSAMAVVVQGLVVGDASGVAFSMSPTDPGLGTVEAVWGLNQGLVDGEVEPDRWMVERRGGVVVQHDSPSGRRWWRAEESLGGVGFGGRGGTAGVVEDVPPELRGQAPLDDVGVGAVWGLAWRLEKFFGRPQDVEWTKVGGVLHVLQSRPISTLAGDARSAGGAQLAGDAEGGGRGGTGGASDPAGDQRGWYLSLHRSFANLQELRRKIEEEELPSMAAEADALQAIDLAGLSSEGLAAELTRRRDAVERWTAVYWRDFIPFAHGMRLFGSVYNDVVKPADPYAFLDLLSGGELLSVERNRQLGWLAARIAELTVGDRSSPLGSPTPVLPPVVAAALDAYLDRFGSGRDAPYPVRESERAGLLRLLREMGERNADTAVPPPRESAEEYLDRFQGDARRFQEKLLDLARASYRLRDDDNLYLGRVEAALQAAQAEAARRSSESEGRVDGGNGDLTGAGVLAGVGVEVRPPALGSHTGPVAGGLSAETGIHICARQLVGQPAGPGLAVGPARVIINRDQLFDFKAGDVLVCDALDPTMTFVAPMAAAVVERRGGMLVHGAIIAREYGLPCVTGIPAATELIQTGDTLTVDGYLGIVVVDRSGVKAECRDVPG